MDRSIERRSFLKGAGALGVLAGMGTLAACSPAKQPEAKGGSAGAEKTHSWEVAPEPIKDIAQTVEADIVVVGAGISGMAAFMWASEAGAKTVIVEKTKTYNGRGLDFGAIDSKVQKAAGITIDKGAILNDLEKSSGYKANGSLIKLWADHSGEVFDRLIDMTIADGGQVTLGEGSAVTGGEDFVTRTYPTDHMFGGVVVESTLELIGRMEKAGIAAGGQSVYEAKAEQLVTDESGRVTGVIVSTKEGNVQYNASKGVILATGDYANNPDMLEAWCPLLKRAEGSVYPTPDANTGDGINMACWAGGSVQSSAHAAMVHPIFGGGALSTASFLKVNKGGKRFCNENTTLPGISNMYMTSEECKVWSVFDSNYTEQMKNASSLSNYNNNTAGPLTKMFMEGTADAMNPPSHEEVVDLCVKDGTTLKADSIAELASLMGVDEKQLQATVDEYNACCDAGVDSSFGKNPEDLNPIKTAPFYASVLTAKILVIASGLNVNDQMEVLTEEDKPVGGLYAVGNVMGNFFANDYPICAPGLSHGRCLTLGALIGEALAKDATL